MRLIIMLLAVAAMPAAQQPASNLEVIRALHRSPSYTKGLLALPELSDDVEWWAAGARERLPWAGTWRGKAGVTEFFRILNSEMKYEKFEAEELVAGDDRVLAIVNAAGRAAKTGQPFESLVVREYQFRDGKIVRVRNFYDTAAYERALGAPALQNLVAIDHIILAINDLDRGVAEFESKTGVRPVFGGVHPGRGTQNALASLGSGSYIEILAPDPKQPNPANPIEGLKALTSLTPTGWALGATDLAAVEKRLQARGLKTSQVFPGSRALPSGARLEWSMLGILEPTHQWQPFFIQWANPALQPSRTSPGGCSLVSAELEDPNPDPLRAVFNAIGFEMTLRKAERSKMTMALQCPKGRVTF